MQPGQRTVCSQVESHNVTQGDDFCDQCGARTKLIADGATQLSPHTTETRLLKYKCGRCSTQVAPNARQCSHCKANLGTEVDIIGWNQQSMKDKGQWSEPDPFSDPFFTPTTQPGAQTAAAPQQQSRPWRLIFLAGALVLALILALVFAAYQAGRANQAEQALAAMPTDAAVIVLPPSPEPTPSQTAEPTAQVQPTQAAVMAPTAANTATALPPTAIPDTRPVLIADTDLHNGTPSGTVLAQLKAGDRFSPSFWMNVGGHVYYFVSAEQGNGWIDSDATDISTDSVKELVLVQGVKAENANRGYISEFNGRQIAFIFTDGTYENRVALPGRDGEWVAITNGDFLMVDKREGTSIYFHTNSNIIDGDPARNIAGVLPEWVVTGEGVPPAPTAVPTTAASSNGASCTGNFQVYRYTYDVSYTQKDVDSSQITYAITGLPAGKCHNFTSIGVVLGGDNGDSLDMYGKRPVIVANSTYRVRLVQWKGDGTYALISEQWVPVVDGYRSTAIFTYNGGPAVR